MKKVFILGSAFLLLAGLFTVACKNTGEETEETEETEEPLPFNVKGIGLPLEYNEDFLKANRTYGAIYWNGDRDPDDWEKNLEYDETSPKDRTYIITEKAWLDEILSVYPDVDFEKEMIVMYGFTSTSGRAVKITSVTLDNKNLKIEFKFVAGIPGYKDAKMPETEFLVLRMDKLDIDTVEFTLLNPRG
jgi:hypothetical protein